MTGPIPRTRWNPCREPKGPNESRSATMRAASTGPIQGRASISASDARSRSTGRGAGSGRREVGDSGRALAGRGAPVADVVDRFGARELRLFPDTGRAADLVGRAARTLSTAERCDASAVRSARDARGSSTRDLTNRTPTPRRSRALRNRRALRSEAVMHRPGRSSQRSGSLRFGPSPERRTPDETDAQRPGYPTAVHACILETKVAAPR
jgi:hypothetical protein